MARKAVNPPHRPRKEPNEVTVSTSMRLYPEQIAAIKLIVSKSRGWKSKALLLRQAADLLIRQQLNKEELDSVNYPKDPL